MTAGSRFHRVGEVFKGFSYFIQSFLFVLVWGLIIVVVSVVVNVIPLLGQILSLALIYGVQALPHVRALFSRGKESVFLGCLHGRASTRSRPTSGPFWDLGVVASIIGSLGAMACGIGVIFTAPIQACILTVAYRENIRGRWSVRPRPDRLRPARQQLRRRRRLPMTTRPWTTRGADDVTGLYRYRRQFVGRLIEASSPGERPGKYREVLRAHLPVALTAGIFLGAIRLWPAGPGWFSICLWSRLTGSPCPFCGFTRSLSAMAHGDWGSGLANAPLSGVLFVGGGAGPDLAWGRTVAGGQDIIGVAAQAGGPQVCRGF